jgi:hypothetical protein
MKKSCGKELDVGIRAPVIKSYWFFFVVVLILSMLELKVVNINN